MVDETRTHGGLWLTQLEGQATHNRVELAWQQDGESVGLTIRLHGQGHLDSLHAGAPAIGTATVMPLSHDAWFV